MTSFFKETCDEGGLAWDDSSNNRAFLSGTISSTLNGASIYIESLRKADQYKTEKGEPLNKDILHAPLPKGPAGQFGLHTFFSHMLMSYSKNQKVAKDFLRRLPPCAQPPADRPSPYSHLIGRTFRCGFSCGFSSRGAPLSAPAGRAEHGDRVRNGIVQRVGPRGEPEREEQRGNQRTDTAIAQ